jgi:Ethanolamine utilization protein EutJ (predicted chaperonin)
VTSQDFSMYAGDSRNLIVTVTDPNNNVINITGATIKWVLVNGDQVVRYKDNQSAGGITITNATNGQFQVSITSNDTTSLPPGTYQHEARMIDSSGNSSLLFTGNVTISKSYV